MGYDGEKFSERAPRSFASAQQAATFARKLLSKFSILKRYRITVEPSNQRRVRTRKKSRRVSRVSGTAATPMSAKRKLNPSIRDPELQQAGKLLQEFSGHEPTEVLRVSERPMRKGLVIGQLDGVLYTTVRDGKTERYIHKFRKQSRPLLTARADGKQLGIVGGRFQMTEAGIEDR